MRRRLALLLALILLATAMVAAPAHAGGLPLGPPSLTETRDVQHLAPGVTETDIVRGPRSATDVSPVPAGFVATRAEARALAAQVSANGGTPRIERVTQRPPDDPR